MNRPEIFIELLRLMLQLAGAAIVARLTVIWALRRYKSERAWERRMTAFSDALVSLGDMRRIVGLWQDEELYRRQFSEEYKAELRERYRSAKRRVEEVTAISQLLLPDSTASVLEKLLKDIAGIQDGGSWFDHVEEEWNLITATIETIILQGRTALGTEFRN